MVVRVDISLFCSGSTNILDMDYVFNTGNGNLKSRTGMMASKETFVYDSLYRLKSVSGPYTMAMDYAANGNITNKTGLGAYAYGAGGAGPHAVTSVATNTGSVLQQDIEYTDFLRPEKITQGNYVLDIEYGPHQQRIKSELKNNGVPVKTIIFAGNYEKITENGVTKEMYYIGDAIYVKQAGQSGKTLYTHKDHLGSIISITDSLGIPVFRATYDPWGKQTLNPANTFSFHRGYTGHEHLHEFELINMNARLYDPSLGRVLQPDMYVQNPFFTQDYNRYSYVRNNPLIYTDPSGDKINLKKWRIVGDILTGGMVSATVAATASATAATALSVVGATAGAVFSSTDISTGGLLSTTILSGVATAASPTAAVIDFGRIFYGTLFGGDNQKGGKDFEKWLGIQAGMLMHPPGLQTMLGNSYSHYKNMRGKVDRVNVGPGYVIVEDFSSGMAVTLGPYINIGEVSDKFNNPWLVHESGHIVQSLFLGPLYMSKIGIPSGISQQFENWGWSDHDRSWFEINANQFGWILNSPTLTSWQEDRYSRSFSQINWWFLLLNPFIF